MAIAPLLAVSGLWAGVEMLPHVAEGFENVLSGLTGNKPQTPEPASGSGGGDSAASLLDQLRKSIKDRLTKSGVNPSDLEQLQLQVDSVGTLHVTAGPAGLESLLNGDPTIRSAALDLVAKTGETSFSLS
jgi:hypothetical protein